MKKLLQFLLGVFSHLVLTSSVLAQVNAGAIYGKVVNESNEAMPLCTVVLMKHSQIATGIISDADGNFIIGNLEPGLYDLKISSIGFASKYIRDIQIDSSEINIPPIAMNWGVMMSSVICSARRPYCDKPCGHGCICECCVPPVKFRGKEPANFSGTMVKVDTTSFLALTGWRGSK